MLFGLVTSTFSPFFESYLIPVLSIVNQYQLMLELHVVPGRLGGISYKPRNLDIPFLQNIIQFTAILD